MLRESVLEHGSGVWHRFVSVFMAARQLSGDVGVAYGVQAVVSTFVAVVVALAWFRNASAAVRNILLVVGTILATPYVQDYDLVVGAFVAAWLLTAVGAKPEREGAAMWSAGLLLVMPLASAPLAKATGLVWAPLFALPAFLLAARLCAGEARRRIGALPIGGLFFGLRGYGAKGGARAAHGRFAQRKRQWH